MNTKNKSAKIYSFIRGGLVTCLLPVFFIYIMVGKPDYRILDSVSGVVVPVAQFVSDGLTFPVRIIGKTAQSIREHNIAKKDNIELRKKLDEALYKIGELETAGTENAFLKRQLNIAESLPQKSVVARIIHDNSVIAHTGFIINAGHDIGIKSNMVVISMQGNMIGIVTTATASFSRVRAISDAKSNIPVRVTGTDVYGFVSGGGASLPTFEFYSDPEFVPNIGNRLVTSGIKGTLPSGIPVGTIGGVDKSSADVTVGTSVRQAHDVMILLFDNGDRYK